MRRYILYNSCIKGIFFFLQQQLRYFHIFTFLLKAAPSTSAAAVVNSDEPDVEKDNSFRQFRRLCADIADENSYTGKTQLVHNYISKGHSGSESDCWEHLLVVIDICIACRQVMRLLCMCTHTIQRCKYVRYDTVSQTDRWTDMCVCVWWEGWCDERRKVRGDRFMCTCVDYLCVCVCLEWERETERGVWNACLCLFWCASI